MDISIVVPLLNEEESLPELCQWIDQVMQEHGYTYEIILMDDGSTDASWNVISRLAKENPSIKGIRFQRNYGKSAALHTGFQHVTGDVVITMDADLQDSPDEIPGLYRMVMEEGYDLVSGWKKKRYDPLSKTVPTKLYNWATRKMSGIKLHDFNCGLKAYRNVVIKNIEIYGEMHRYIPVIAKWAGFGNIGEKVVQHRARQYGETKFGMERFIRGPLDLLTISFVGKFRKRPMHLFGILGTIIFIIGFGIAGYLVYVKIFHDVYKMTDRPLFYFGLLCMVLGTQLFMTGFLAELVSRNASDKNQYNIAEYTFSDNH
ncbi:MAG TPA: glycosyltransferase family 2 protein [Bacteroidales bacterium]|nr:glycosyltransferase family 2 protein [Bacteroidales bacterium]